MESLQDSGTAVHSYLFFEMSAFNSQHARHCIGERVRSPMLANHLNLSKCSGARLVDYGSRVLLWRTTAEVYGQRVNNLP